MNKLKLVINYCITRTKFWSIIPWEFAILIFQFHFIRGMEREKNNLVPGEKGNFLLYRPPMRILNNPTGEKRNPVKKRRNYARWWIHGRLGFVERGEREGEREKEKGTERLLFRRWLKTTANFITRRFAATGVSKLEPAPSLPRFCFDEALNFTRGGSFVILWEGKFPPFLFFSNSFPTLFHAVTIFFPEHVMTNNEPRVPSASINVIPETKFFIRPAMHGFVLFAQKRCEC